MIHRSSLVMISILLLLSGCCSRQNEYKIPDDKADTKKDEEAIKAVLIEMWDAIEKRDIDRYASYVHPEFTQFGESDSVLLVGKYAEVASVKNWMEHSTNVHTEMIEPRITIIGDIAWVVYYWADSGYNDGVPFRSRGKSTRIFILDKGKWLCIHGHYTFLP